MRVIIFTITFCLLSIYAFAEISFTDHTGKNITLEKVPERVVVLNSSNLELFFASGGKPIAYAESSTMPEYLKLMLKDIPSMGRVNNPDIEKIVSINPDLVIGMNFPFHLSIRESIEAAGIKTAMFSIKNISHIKETMDIFGKISGHTETAEQSWNNINSKLEKVKKTTDSLQKKKALIVYGSPESFNMALPDSFIGQLLESAGGLNIALPAENKSKNAMFKGFVPVSLEYALVKDPDIIFVITHEGGISPVADNTLLLHPAWKGLRAVQAGNVIKLPFATFGINPTVRTGDAVEELAKLMYGDKI